MNESAPQHDTLSSATRAIELASILAAIGLVIALVLRFALTPDMLTWWTPVVCILAMVAADFMSGMLHWLADTWGRDTMPILGRRLLRPFRVHHVNPDDFLRRDFIDTNGDVALLVAPFLILGLTLPLDSSAGQVGALFLAVFGIAALPTNQIHQWAHMSHPPGWVKRLQAFRLILSRRQHLKHHAEPYNKHYCITFGWCNEILDVTNFFQSLERIITRLTGLQPRENDTAFINRSDGAEVNDLIQSRGDQR